MPKKKREIIEKDGKLYTKRGVELTRNLNTETEAEHMSKIRSSLRRSNRFWKPILKALELAHRPYEGENKRMKHEYQCSQCKEWKPRKDVEVNHVIPCGSLQSYADVPEFLRRLFCEDVDGFNVLCKSCHKEETAKQRGDYGR
jgi:hypothetical protein